MTPKKIKYKGQEYVLAETEIEENITLADMTELCPDCATAMAQLGLTEINAATLFAKIEDDLPKWKKIWHSLTEGKKHKKTACHDKLSKHMTDEQAWGECNKLFHLFETKK